MNPQTTARTPVTIVCVSNDEDVLRACLAASVERGLEAAPRTQFLVIDNRDHRFASAGAALNHGARAAVNDVVVFAHQDVFLHSLPALEAAAHDLLADPAIGVMGAVGIDRRGRIVGRIRDRVVPIGEPAPRPRDVDSMDEVLFLLTREQVLREPLSEAPELAWHAYAVEYCLRMRRAGRRAAVRDVPLTHNSLTENLLRLDVAHRAVGDAYPELLPIRTTCGTVHGGDGRVRRLARKARGARRWWRESLLARAAARHTSAPVVLADIRILVDDAARLCDLDALRAIDVTHDDRPSTTVDGLKRFGRPFSAASLSVAEAAGALADRAPGEAIVVSGLRPADLAVLDPGPPAVVGLSRDTGLWLVAGVDPAVTAPLWSAPRNRPFAGLALRPALSRQPGR